MNVEIIKEKLEDFLSSPILKKDERIQDDIRSRDIDLNPIVVSHRACIWKFVELVDFINNSPEVKEISKQLRAIDLEKDVEEKERLIKLVKKILAPVRNLFNQHKREVIKKLSIFKKKYYFGSLDNPEFISKARKKIEWVFSNMYNTHSKDVWAVLKLGDDKAKESYQKRFKRIAKPKNPKGKIEYGTSADLDALDMNMIYENHKLNKEDSKTALKKPNMIKAQSKKPKIIEKFDLDLFNENLSNSNWEEAWDLACEKD